MLFISQTIVKNTMNKEDEDSLGRLVDKIFGVVADEVEHDKRIQELSGNLEAIREN